MPESIYCQRSYRQQAANNGTVWIRSKMQKAADAADIPVLFFSAGANFRAILGHFWAILAILGHFWAKLDNFGSFLGYFG